MLKLAYRIGMKLAEMEQAAADVGGIGENGERSNAASDLAKALQALPVSVDLPDIPPSPGDPDEDDSYGESSINYAFNDLSRIGLDIQGPMSTSM